MKRYHQEFERTRQVHQDHLRWIHNWPKRIVDCECELQTGRFRKQKALGCRTPRCLLCHYDKLLKIPSVKDRIREQSFADSLKDYLESKETK